MKYLNQVTAALFVAVTLLMSLASCGGKDPREKAIEDLYLSFRNGDVIIQQVENFKDRFTENEYKEAIEKAKEGAAEMKKTYNEQFGTYQHYEVVDSAYSPVSETTVYYIRFKNTKKDLVNYFEVKKDDSGNYTAVITSPLTYMIAVKDNGREPLPDER